MSITKEYIEQMLIHDKENGIYQHNRASFTNQEIFDLEMKYIFEGNWVFLAHESQIPNINDYFTTTIGKQSVVITKNKDGILTALINSCTHKGAQLCRHKKGNKSSFTCPFHNQSHWWRDENAHQNIHRKELKSNLYRAELCQIADDHLHIGSRHTINAHHLLEFIHRHDGRVSRHQKAIVDKLEIHILPHGKKQGGVKVSEQTVGERLPERNDAFEHMVAKIFQAQRIVHQRSTPYEKTYSAKKGIGKIADETSKTGNPQSCHQSPVYPCECLYLLKILVCSHNCCKITHFPSYNGRITIFFTFLQILSMGVGGFSIIYSTFALLLKTWASLTRPAPFESSRTGT